jgi:hypothetical protein
MSSNRKILSYLIAAIAAVSMGVTAFASVPEEPSSQISSGQSVYQAEDTGQEIEDTETSSAETPQNKSDAPLFVGAGISVIVFGGVVVFCSIKGNR